MNIQSPVGRTRAALAAFVGSLLFITCPTDGLAHKKTYDHIIQPLSRHYGIDPALVKAIIYVESRYNPRAVSPKGASGLMQLLPSTARRFH